MARFELDDGTLRKFWEIELDGEVLRFRYGELGSTGRARSKQHSSVQSAHQAHERAVRSMADQGYVRRLRSPPPRADVGPAWAALEADPEDRAALQVHADWLLCAGDPRGELLSTQLAADEAVGPRKELLEREVAHILEREQDPLIGGAYPGGHSLVWGLGYVDTAVLGLGGIADGDPAESTSRLLHGPAFRLVRDLTLRVPCAVQIALSGRFPALRRLALHTSMSECGGRGGAPFDLDRLAEVAPRLNVLQVRGDTDVRGEAALRALHDLDVRWMPGWRARLAARVLPARLGLHGVDSEVLDALRLEGVELLRLSPAWAADVGEMLSCLGGRSLKRLELNGVEVDAELAAPLASMGLQQLSIAGTVTPDGLARLQAVGLEPEGPWKLVHPSDFLEDPERPALLQIRRYDLRSARGSWYWEIGVHGVVHHVRYGRNGREGRWVWRRFPTEDVAEEMAQRRIEEKLKEGYRGADDLVALKSP